MILRYAIGLIGSMGMAMAQGQFVTVVSGDTIDYPRGIAFTSDSGFMVLGESCGFGAWWRDILLFKLDPSGNLLWARMFREDSSEDYACFGHNIVSTADGGAVILGNSWTCSYTLLSRFDGFGNHLWSKIMEGVRYENIILAGDSTIALAGWTDSYGAGSCDIVVSRFDLSGKHLWTRTLGGPGSDLGYGLVSTADGSVVVAGTTRSSDTLPSDIIVSRFDASGNHLWSMVTGTRDSESPEAIVRTTDGDVAIAGYTADSNGIQDIIICRFDGSGNHLWTKTLGGESFDLFRALIPTQDGGLVVAGLTTSFGLASQDILISRFDGSGNHLWTRTVGGNGWEYAYDMTSTPDGSILIVRATQSFGNFQGDAIMIRLDALGNHLWTKTLGGYWRDQIHRIINIPGGFAAIGHTLNFGLDDNGDILVCRFDTSGNTCMGNPVNPTVLEVEPIVTRYSAAELSPTVMEVTPTVDESAIVISPMPKDTLVCTNVAIQEVTEPSGLKMVVSGTSIRFYLPCGIGVRLSLYDPTGRLVLRPLDGWLEPGGHEVKLGERTGSSLQPGVYFVELDAGAQNGAPLRAKLVIR